MHGIVKKYAANFRTFKKLLKKFADFVVKSFFKEFEIIFG